MLIGHEARMLKMVYFIDGMLSMKMAGMSPR